MRHMPAWLVVNERVFFTIIEQDLVSRLGNLLSELKMVLVTLININID